MGAGGPGADIGLIEKALEDMEENLLNECKRLFAPAAVLNDFKTLTQEDINSLFKRVSNIEKGGEKNTQDIGMLRELNEANRKAMTFQKQDLQKLKEQVDNLAAQGGLNHELIQMDEVREPEEGRQQMLAYIRQLNITT